MKSKLHQIYHFQKGEHFEENWCLLLVGRVQGTGFMSAHGCSCMLCDLYWARQTTFIAPHPFHLKPNAFTEKGPVF